jgi:hypothetical protein
VVPLSTGMPSGQALRRVCGGRGLGWVGVGQASLAGSGGQAKHKGESGSRKAQRCLPLAREWRGVVCVPFAVLSVG